MVPVDDPWGEGTDTDTDTNIPVTNTDPDPEPVSGTGTDPEDPSDPGSEPEEPEPVDDATDGGQTDDEDPANGSDEADPVDDTSDTLPDTPPDTPDTTDPEPEPEPEDDVTDEDAAANPLPVKFEYYAPGDLIPGTGFGQGDGNIYAPDMVFPIRTAPTFPQSMVYRLGGAVGGDQCDPENFSVPWRDNFCETRSSNRNTPLCPTNKVHQGQDIRVGNAADCNAMRRQSAQERGLHEVVAVEDGIIQHIGTYSVKLKGTETGNIYSYLHLNMRRLRVSALDTVEAGDTIGFVSNDFGGTPTTYHLHFEIKAPIEGEGIVHVPPYMSLIAAYERREGGLGMLVEDDTVEVASVPVIVDPSKLIE
jgi:murein DD-endopeptidase MepM/ murein hydrolase activator NlpD